MSKEMKTAAIGSVAATVICGILLAKTKEGIWLTLTITFGTIAYHLCIRLFLGLLFNVIMNNHADYESFWFKPRKWEKKLYEILRVKQWKDKMPTFFADTFNPKLHSWDEIAQAMCQSELVHEVNIIISFLPMIMVIWFDSFWVFFLTSMAAALFDLIFVVMQRYNRPRIINLLKRKNKNK